ncbi:MAG: metallophosphoesterase [Kiritimatiellae bacterium]|nr:metallophosphoesterase [Kiritimatiellia bacterium]
MNITRRGFIFSASGAAALAGCGLYGEKPSGGRPLVRFGMVADLHYAALKRRWSRHYGESVRKLDEAVELFNARKPDFAIELGDLKDDSNGHDGTLVRLEEVERSFAKFKGPRYHVVGNHDCDCITPEEFFSRTPNGGKTMDRGWYSFVSGGVSFIVLDGCFTKDMKHYDRSNPWTDANIPPEELAWLEGELSKAEKHAVVFVHQRLDPASERHHLMRNAKAVRKVLEASGKVRAVVTGHQHDGGHSVVNGIPYYTLRAMVEGPAPEGNSYAEGAVWPSGAFTVTGWRKAESLSA